jgi:SAM-dependent methyltransferase
MDNPWLHIPLADYEAHMASAAVGQAALLADLFAAALARHQPPSVALLGCAGGNGLDRVDPAVTPRTVGIDLNPDYIAQARARFAARLPGLELYAGNVQTDTFRCDPVDLVFAGLVLEFVDLGPALTRIRALLRPGGVLVTVVQLPCATLPEVTPSPYTSLARLAPVMHLVPPADLTRAAAACGYRELHSHSATTPAGKSFQIQEFRPEA